MLNSYVGPEDSLDLKPHLPAFPFNLQRPSSSLQHSRSSSANTPTVTLPASHLIFNTPTAHRPIPESHCTYSEKALAQEHLLIPNQHLQVGLTRKFTPLLHKFALNSICRWETHWPQIVISKSGRR